ncbi:MAG: LacI family DNA-binding transcriptional regulator [Clostridia bacterium]|nr:LacI family DNA-binding transcriptional regulator [Clostridia bacterium]
MHIKIYVHPESKESFWARFSLRAVAAEILRKRYTPEYIEEDRVTDIDFDKLFKAGEKRVIMYIGFSPRDTLNDLSYLTAHGVHTLMLNYGYEEFSGACSRVLLNCRDAMEKSISYLLGCNRDRIALFGVTPSSSTDMIRLEVFSEYLSSIGRTLEDDTYYNYGAMSECREKFVKNISNYNAVICVNEVAAFILLRWLRDNGINVPRDLYVISCGYSTMLSEHSVPTLTSVSADQSEVGAQAVIAYSSLMRNPANISLTVQVEAKLTVRGSTDFTPDTGVLPFAPENAGKPTVNFFGDPSVRRFFSIETLLLESDELDRGILDGLLSGDTYPKMAERLYTSENVISYRIKRMCKISGANSKTELLKLVTPYLK